jgi:hypothetical protein
VIPIDSKTTKFSAKIHSMIKKITQSLWKVDKVNNLFRLPHKT